MSAECKHITDVELMRIAENLRVHLLTQMSMDRHVSELDKDIFKVLKKTLEDYRNAEGEKTTNLRSRGLDRIADALDMGEQLRERERNKEVLGNNEEMNAALKLDQKKLEDLGAFE